MSSQPRTWLWKQISLTSISWPVRGFGTSRIPARGPVAGPGGRGRGLGCVGHLQGVGETVLVGLGDGTIVGAFLERARAAQEHNHADTAGERRSAQQTPAAQVHMGNGCAGH